MTGSRSASLPEVHETPRGWLRGERPARKITAQLVALVVSRGVLLLSTVVVARIAGVADFGSFALALVVFQAGLLLRDAGLGQAVIVLGGRHTGVTWYAFLAVSALGIVLAGLMALAADPILALLGLPSGSMQLRLLAVAFGIGSLGVVSNATLERRLRFEARAIIDVAAYSALGIVAIGGVLSGLGVEALAFGYIAQGSVQTIGGLLLAPPWAEPSGDRSALGAFARYGGLLWASAVLSYVATNVDNAVVGRLGGAATLGIYALSYTVGNTVTISLAQVLNRVALPYYAQSQSEGRSSRDVLTSVLPLSVAASSVPAAIIIGLAPELRDTLFSPGDTLLPLVLLSLYGVVRTLGVSMGTALNGVGLVGIQLRSSTVNVGLLALGVVPGFLVGGPAGVAFVVLFAVCASTAYLARPLRRQFHVSLGFVWRPVFLLGIVTLLTALPGGPAPLAVRLLAGLVTAGYGTAWAARIALAPSETDRPTARIG